MGTFRSQQWIWGLAEQAQSLQHCHSGKVTKGARRVWSQRFLQKSAEPSIYVPWGYYSRDGKILVSGHGDESKQAEIRSHVCLLAALPSLPEAGRDGQHSKDASQPHAQLRAGLCGVSGSQIGLWEANNPPRVPVENLTRCKSPSKTPCQSSSITSELV